MAMKFVLSYVVLRATVLTAVIAGIIPNKTFDEFVELQDKENACPFPPISLMDKEERKPCLETNRTGSLVQICDGIVQISQDVCKVTNISIPGLLLSTETYNISQICAELEKRTVFGENDACLDVCAEGANHICKLNVALYQRLYTYFRGLKNHSDVHHVIHRLARYFPFPPHGTMDQGNFLEACAKEGQTNVTNLLCSAIKELAARSGEQNSKALTFHDVMSNVTIEWNPCPAINGSLNISNSICENNCTDGPNSKICRSIALGLIHLKLSGNSSGTTVITTQNTNIGGNQEDHSQDSRGTTRSPVESTSTTNVNKDNSTVKADNEVLDGENQVTTGNNPINASAKTGDPTPPSDRATVTNTTKSTLDDGSTTKTPKLSRNGTATIGTSTNATLQSESPSSTTPVDQNSEGNVSSLKPTAGGQDLLSPSELDVNDGASNEVDSNQPDTDQDTQPTPIEPGTGKYINSDLDGVSMDNVVDAKMDKEEKDEVYSDGDDDGSPGGISFMSYFLVFLVVCVAGYIFFHNKKKIIALVIEGKSASSGRRPSSKEYKRLKTDDVMPSLEKSANTSNYIY